MARQAKKWDPLAFIPSAKAIRTRLDAIVEEERRLRVLLETAGRIERGEFAPSMPATEAAANA